VLGELHHALTTKAVSSAKALAELGEVVAGRKPGRTADEQITIADLTGTGIQDTAIATLAFQRVGDQDALVVES
jgi:ornithine cyclodeaminase